MLSPILLGKMTRAADRHKTRVWTGIFAKDGERFYVGEVAKFLGRSPKAVYDYGRANYFLLMARPEAKDPLWYMTRRGLARCIVHFRFFEGRPVPDYEKAVIRAMKHMVPKKPRKKQTKAQTRRYHRNHLRWNDPRPFWWLPPDEFTDKSGALYGREPPDDDPLP